MILYNTFTARLHTNPRFNLPLLTNSFKILLINLMRTSSTRTNPFTVRFTLTYPNSIKLTSRNIQYQRKRREKEGEKKGSVEYQYAAARVLKSPASTRFREKKKKSQEVINSTRDDEGMRALLAVSSIPEARVLPFFDSIA